MDIDHGVKVALKKLARPFQTAVHAKRTYRELRYLKHLKHENVSCQTFGMTFGMTFTMTFGLTLVNR